MSLSPPRSRDATPSTASASSQSAQSAQSHRADGAGGSSTSFGVGSSQSPSQPQTQSQPAGEDEADKFRRRLELEQTMQVLQQRLELANIKAKNGWTGMSIHEIETRLPPTPPRRRREDMRIVTGPQGHVSCAATSASAPSSSRPIGTVSATYEPPSPSRPWQLVDVLWQPLPPPSRGYPASPGSPLKRSRQDDDSKPPSRPMDRVNGHARRASGSNHPISPIEQVKRREKKRSQSHSHARLPPTTQDFNAARALTEMLGSGSPSSVSPSSFRRSSVAGNTSGPLSSTTITTHRSQIHAHSSLPLPPAFDHEPPRRASSVTPGRHSRPPPRPPSPRSPRPQPDEEDTNAAELMMFLAHSPSPATQPHDPPMRTVGGAARVLFAEDGPGRVEKHSNLALAPPITANGDDKRFGGLL